MRHVIIGMGEIGTSLFQFLDPFVRKLSTYDVKTGGFLSEHDILHICYPWHDDFVKTTLDYREQCLPRMIIIHSTVPVGTTREIAKHVPCLHMPVEGKHPNLVESMRAWKWPIGCDPKDIKEATAISYLLKTGGIDSTVVTNPEATEAMKILSTTRYGMDIIFARMANRILQDFGVKNYDLVIQYTRAYNELYAKLGMHQFTRPLIQPSNEPIGGHCVKQNLELLQHPEMEKIKKFILDNELYGNR